MRFIGSKALLLDNIKEVIDENAQDISMAFKRALKAASTVGPGTFRTVMEPTAGADSTPNTVFIANCTGYVPSLSLIPI